MSCFLSLVNTMHNRKYSLFEIKVLEFATRKKSELPYFARHLCQGMLPYFHPTTQEWAYLGVNASAEPSCFVKNK